MLIGPRVSVVIPVYNAGVFLREAMASILEQTFADFELLVIDDASTDSSVEVARSFGDSRIRIIVNDTNRGQAAAQNVGLRQARGEYIAILGHDDIAFPDRLRQQVAFLDENPDIALVGTAILTLMPNGALNFVSVPTDPIANRWHLLYENPIAAPAVLLRRSILESVGYFDESIRFGEDLDLWGRIAQSWKIAQLDVALTKYRVHSRSLTRTMGEQRTVWQIDLIKRNITRLAGITVRDGVTKSFLNLTADLTQADVLENYEVIWECACVFCNSVAQTAQARQVIFTEMLHIILRLARQSEADRLIALRLAVHYGWRYARNGLLTPGFARFALRVILPATVRQRFRWARPAEIARHA